MLLLHMRDVSSPDIHAKALPCVLLAEDSDDDYFIFHRAMTKASNEFIVVRAEDGAKAIEYLQNNLKNPPSMVITDLKMPVVDGFGVIAWLRSNPQLVNVPVLVWSGSELPKDLARAKLLGARAYHVKGSNYDELAALLAEVCGGPPSLGKV
jgi:CheY-like chemotaxis protein